ncbi:hypothetical protein INR49_002772, partial [Caranx melampygus]
VSNVKLGPNRAGAKLKASEDDSKLKVSEEDSKLKASEDDLKLKASEDDSKLKASENDSKVKVSDDHSKIKASEENSKLKVSEDHSKIKVSEEDSKLKVSADDTELELLLSHSRQCWSHGSGVLVQASSSVLQLGWCLLWLMGRSCSTGLSNGMIVSSSQLARWLQGRCSVSSVLRMLSVNSTSHIVKKRMLCSVTVCCLLPTSLTME